MTGGAENCLPLFRYFSLVLSVLASNVKVSAGRGFEARSRRFVFRWKYLDSDVAPDMCLMACVCGNPVLTSRAKRD